MCTDRLVYFDLQAKEIEAIAEDIRLDDWQRRDSNEAILSEPAQTASTLRGFHENARTLTSEAAGLADGEAKSLDSGTIPPHDPPSTFGGGEAWLRRVNAARNAFAFSPVATENNPRATEHLLAISTVESLRCKQDENAARERSLGLEAQKDEHVSGHAVMELRRKAAKAEEEIRRDTGKRLTELLKTRTKQRADGALAYRTLAGEWEFMFLMDLASAMLRIRLAAHTIETHFGVTLPEAPGKFHEFFSWSRGLLDQALSLVAWDVETTVAFRVDLADEKGTLSLESASFNNWRNVRLRALSAALAGDGTGLCSVMIQSSWGLSVELGGVRAFTASPASDVVSGLPILNHSPIGSWSFRVKALFGAPPPSILLLCRVAYSHGSGGGAP